MKRTGAREQQRRYNRKVKMGNIKQKMKKET
jgi:hypothetical protein